MNKIVARLVLPTGDKYFLAFDFVEAIANQTGAGGNVGKRAACLWFGQCHRALPLALEYFWDERFYLFIGAKAGDEPCRVGK